jgi:formylglycine-generating enzyme required for sulfatase activity
MTNTEHPISTPIQSSAVGKVFQDLPTAPQMVMLPSGSFLMGSAENDADGYYVERPQHKVTIAYKLAMGRCPVTFEEWDACVAEGFINYEPEDESWGRGKRPVVNVSWKHAQAYAAWLNRKLGMKAIDPTRYRLPSEAEWEYACRAGTTGNYSTANGKLSDSDATYNASDVYQNQSAEVGKKHDKTTPVGIYAPNPWGLYGVDPISRTPYCSSRRSPRCPDLIPPSRRIRRNFVSKWLNSFRLVANPANWPRSSTATPPAF